MQYPCIQSFLLKKRQCQSGGIVEPCPTVGNLVYGLVPQDGDHTIVWMELQYCTTINLNNSPVTLTV